MIFFISDSCSEAMDVVQKDIVAELVRLNSNILLLCIKVSQRTNITSKHEQFVFCQNWTIQQRIWSAIKQILATTFPFLFGQPLL